MDTDDYMLDLNPYNENMWLPDKDEHGNDVAKEEGVTGSRIMGGGFGGCTVSLVRDEAIDEFKRFVGAEYEKKTGLKADFYVAEIGDGVARLE